MRHDFDADAWVRATLGILNDAGGRGYDHGVRIVCCPFCGDTKGKGWVNVVTKRMQCFWPACPIHSGIGVVEAVRSLEGFTTWHEALLWLAHEYPATEFTLGPAPPPKAYADWMKWPAGATPIAPAEGMLAKEALRFIQTQWGLTEDDALFWGLRYCTRGKHAWRILIPIRLFGEPIAFVSRTYRGGANKYLTSEHEVECGRPGDALLFNLDAVEPGRPALLVEGTGDVMRWAKLVRCSDGYITAHSPGDVHGGNSYLEGDDVLIHSAIGVGCLGTVLTEEKVAMIAAKRPSEMLLGFDADAPMKEGMTAFELLLAWGIPTRRVRWVGAKDAGAGALPQLLPPDGLTSRVTARLGRYLTRVAAP